jgi:hypothetical protein
MNLRALNGLRHQMRSSRCPRHGRYELLTHSATMGHSCVSTTGPTSSSTLLQLSLRFQGRASARRRHSAAVTGVGAVARRDARKSGGQVCRLGISAEGGHWRQGTLVTGGGRAEPPPLRGGARRGLPAARSAPPVRSARGTRRNERASWRARERPAATSTRATTPSRGLIQQSSNSAPARFREKSAPRTATGNR